MSIECKSITIPADLAARLRDEAFRRGFADVDAFASALVAEHLPEAFVYGVQMALDQVPPAFVVEPEPVVTALNRLAKRQQVIREIEREQERAGVLSP